MAFTTRWNGFVQQKTDETFVQISNCPENISFAGNIKVELIDSCGITLHEIIVGENFFYNEFLDINGIKQIAFEFGQIGIDFHQELLYLKLTHTVSNDLWFSNGFFITNDNQEETTLFEYKNDTYFRGISYDKQNIYQSIRLTCFKNDIDSTVESEEYTQITGSPISSRAIITNIDKYLFYTCNFFTYTRLVTLLNHNLIFINNYRVSNKPKAAKGERIVPSNIFEVNFEANPTESYRATEYQIWPKPAPETEPDYDSVDYNNSDYFTTI